MLEREFYCVACRKKVTIPANDICVKVYKNKRVPGGSPALVGHCNKCSTQVTKFIKKDSKDRMIQKFGLC